MRKQLLIALCMATLTACSDHNEPEKPAPQVGGVIPQGHLKAMEKAKGVSDTLQQAVDQRAPSADPE